MATSIIDPDQGAGYDYASLAIWEAAKQASLSAPEIAQCRCTGGTADPGRVLIDGWTTSDTNYIKIFVESGYRHNGSYQNSGNVFRCYQASDGIAFRFYEAYVWIDGIAYGGSTSMSGRDVIETASTTLSGWIKISNCIVKGNNSSNSISRAFDMGFPDAAQNQHYYHWNCMAMDCYSRQFVMGGTYNNNTAWYLNCTSYGSYSYYGFTKYTVRGHYYNCISNDNSLGSWLAGGVNYGLNNVKDTGSTPSYNYITGEVTFVNEGIGDVRLSSSDTVARGKGIDLTIFLPTKDLPMAAELAYDIIGTYRGGGEGEHAWDIGAYQVTTSDPAESISIVDPSMGAGYDYASLSAWEAAEQDDITACGTNVIAVAECRGGQDLASGTIGIDGWSTHKNNYILVRNHVSEPTNGYWDTSRYYLEFGTAGRWLYIYEEAVRVQGVQFLNSSNSQTADAQYLLRSNYTAGYSEVHFHVINCIVKIDETATGTKALFFDNNNYGQSYLYLIGSMWITNEDWMQVTHDMATEADVLYFTALNNTFVGDDLGFFINGTNGADIIQCIRNNIIVSDVTNTVYYPVETTANLWTNDDSHNNYNADTDTRNLTYHPARGSNGRYGQTFDFVDDSPVNLFDWDIRLNSTDTGAKGYGENLFDNTASNIPQYIKDFLVKDITQTKRPTAGHAVAWDIGAHQVVKMPSGYHLMV